MTRARSLPDREARCPASCNRPATRRLRAFIVAKRKAVGLTQAEVGARLGRHQPFVSEVEAGQRRLSAVELMDLAEAIERMKG